MPDEIKKIIFIVISFVSALVVTFCYLLPVILVFFGMGRIIAELTLHFPWLIPLTQRKFFMFSVTALLLLFTDRFFRKHKMDFKCNVTSVSDYSVLWPQIILNISLVLWFISFMAAYVITSFFLLREIL